MSQPTTAVILAAGLGERLGRLGDERPKGFIELGGKPIVERSLERLAVAGIDRTIIVIGHRASFYEELAARVAGIELVHNPRYAESGSMYSLYLARDRISDDFVLLESDLIYEHRALDVMLGVRAANNLLVSGPTSSGDEVYVEAQGGRLTGLSKTRKELTGTVIGELVGITRLTPACLHTMCAYAGLVFRDSLRLDYEQALVAAGREVPVECTVVNDLLWSEIDDEHHLQRATSLYPRIRACDAGIVSGPTRYCP